MHAQRQQQICLIFRVLPSDVNDLAPQKHAGFASISGTACGKSGMDMSTPVDPVATPLAGLRGKAD